MSGRRPAGDQRDLPWSAKAEALTFLALLTLAEEAAMFFFLRRLHVNRAAVPQMAVSFTMPTRMELWWSPRSTKGLRSEIRRWTAAGRVIFCGCRLSASA